jgi:hypothetical protein
MENEIAASEPHTRRRLARVKDAQKYALVGNTKLYSLIARGAIKAVKLDGTTLVDLDSVDAYHASLPEVARS